MRIGITGHQHIPAAAIPFIESELARLIASSTGNITGVSSLAVGADQLFASEILKHGGQLHIVLPSENYFKTFSNTADLHRFYAILQNATEVETLPFPSPSEEAFLSAGHRIVDLSDRLLAVWDGAPPRGKGGTGDIVAYAQQKGCPLVVIWPTWARPR